jgi:hypothetical protein
LNRYVFVLAAAALLASACFLPSDPGAPKELGVSRRGLVLVGYYNPCGGGENAVIAISLLVSGGKVGSGDDEPIWQVTSEGSSVAAFTIGDAPEGFETLVSLGSLPPDAQLILEVRSEASETRVAFTESDLVEGSFLLAGNRRMSEERYRSADTCKLED